MIIGVESLTDFRSFILDPNTYWDESEMAEGVEIRPEVGFSFTGEMAYYTLERVFKTPYEMEHFSSFPADPV